MTDSVASCHRRLLGCLRSLLWFRAAAYARQLTRCLSQTRDPRQGSVYLGSQLRGFSPEAVIAVLSGLMEEADCRRDGADAALQAMMCLEMRASWTESFSRQVQAVARREGKFDLAGILLELPEEDPRLGKYAGKLDRELSEVPLGTRKAWARRMDNYMLERLIFDPDRAVVANILDNPRLTLRDVVRMASQTPVREEVLEAISRHPRWITQYQVKLTLAYNPSTPTRISLALLHFLMSQDLKELCRDTRLSRVLIRRAEGVLEERIGREKTGGGTTSSVAE